MTCDDCFNRTMAYPELFSGCYKRQWQRSEIRMTGFLGRRQRCELPRRVLRGVPAAWRFSCISRWPSIMAHRTPKFENSRWQTAVILKIVKSPYVNEKQHPVLMKFGNNSRFGTRWQPPDEIWICLKLKMADGCYIAHECTWDCFADLSSD